jgi:signal transduction histidine kinase
VRRARAAPLHLERSNAIGGPNDLGFLVVAPVVIVVLAQWTDPGSFVEVLLLVPAMLAYLLRGLLPGLPEEAFAALVIVPVTAVVGNDGSLEGSFFLIVTMVLSVSWSLGSVARAGLIAAAAALAPWLVAEHLAPASGVGWVPWATASVFTFTLGRALHRQAALITALEAARQALAEQAVADERRRIARELHDLAGHTLAAMLLHVTGARHVLRRDVDEAERALQDAEAVGRSSLDQIRATVAALRTDERGTDPALAGSADLAGLIESYRRAGIDITADIASREIDGPVGTALHRIAREALANVAQHAPRNRVELHIDTTADAVEMTVVDRGEPGRRPDPQAMHFGLVGMAERARALGGAFEAGPTSDGWRVATMMPLTGSESAPVPP